MSTATDRYFHSSALKKRFIDDLDNARDAKVLNAGERAWLHKLCSAPVKDDMDPVRVDRLLLDDGSDNPFELSAALLLSHTKLGLPRVYLFTLAKGMEAFDDRLSLSTTLRARYAANAPTAVFEYEKVEGEAFEAQMLAIVDHQVAHITQLSEHLRQMPGLYSACTASLKTQLRKNLPRMSIDPETHLLQMISTDEGADTVLLTQTLAQAAFNEYRKFKVVNGATRRYLDKQGEQASEVDSPLFAKSMTDALAGISGEFDSLLSTFWSATWRGTRTRKDLAVESFTNSLRHQLYAAHQDETLTETTLREVLALVQSSSAPANDTTSMRCEKLTVTLGEHAALALAGTFILRKPGGTDSSVLWFAPDHSLKHFSDLVALTSHLATSEGRGELRPALALEHQLLLLREDPLLIGQEQVLTSLVADRVDSIIALQALNAVHAIGLVCDDDKKVAMIDDALDIRELLDPRQLQLFADRWRSSAPFNFGAIWRQPSMQASATVPVTVPAQGAATRNLAQAQADITGTALEAHERSWPELTHAFDQRAQHLRQHGVVLEQYADRALQPYVSVLLGTQVKVQEVRVQWLESKLADLEDVEVQPVAVSESQLLLSMDLRSLLLERVSGLRADALPTGTQVFIGGTTASAVVRSALINHMLDQVASGFTEGYVQCFGLARKGLQRQGDDYSLPDESASALREASMRLDLSLSDRQGWLEAEPIAMAQQVLDRPSRALRSPRGGTLTEAFTLSLVVGDQSVVTLCDTLVFKRSDQPDGRITLWSCTLGWRQFASIVHLQNALQHKLLSNDRERWLQLLSERDRRCLEKRLLKPSPDNRIQLRLDNVLGHTVQALTEHARLRQQQDLRQLCERAGQCRLEAGLFIRMAESIETDRPLHDTLDALWVRVDGSLFHAMLPKWIRDATTADLVRLRDLFLRYYLLSEGGKDFLFDLPSQYQYAKEKITAELVKAFPDSKLDPDAISVTVQRVSSAVPPAGQIPWSAGATTVSHTESLTAYAINRYLDYPDFVPTVSSASGDLPASLNGDYVRTLVRRLNLGAGYLAQLKKAMREDDSNYATRKRLFINQSPSIFLAEALTEKLNNRLSSQAYQLVANVLEMPDSQARETNVVPNARISPLKLVAGKDMEADEVTGVYLFYSSSAEQGPIVLLALHYSACTFKEYTTQAALLEDIGRDPALKAMVLERLDPDVKSRYAHLGLSTPQVPFQGGPVYIPAPEPEPVTLQLDEEKGNALVMLFNGTVNLILYATASRAVTNDRADHAAHVYLATLGAQQLLTILPGRLAVLVGLWQGAQWLHASASSALRHQWGEAFAELCAAMSSMLLIKAGPGRKESLDERSEEGAEPESGTTPRPTSSARGTSFTVRQRARLQALEAHDVALKNLRHDPLLNLYTDKDGNTFYAVVEGRVYQVRQTSISGEWGIVDPDADSDSESGLLLKADDEQTWQLDLQPVSRIRGGGAASKEASIVDDVDQVMTVEASGMQDIRLMYRDRARRIGQAHLQAKQYLENCLDNLNLHQRHQPLDPRVQKIIDDFFGLSTPAATQRQGVISQTRDVVHKLYNAVMDPSLSPFSSSRFVVGTGHPVHKEITAFVVDHDPKQRIFLTDQFFTVPRYDLKPGAATQGFNLGAHYRAATLIHELTHQSLNTYDIAYLESMSPYPDLLVDSGTTFRVRQEVEGLHQRALSHLSIKTSLFTVMSNGMKRDISPSDNRGYGAILRMTKTSNLADARDVFMSDPDIRHQVMFANADSVALLVLLLGRTNFRAPSP